MKPRGKQPKEQGTQRKRADYSLFESEEKIRSIVTTVIDGIVTIDDHGIMDSFNPAAEKIFGYRASEVIGKNVSMLMPVPYRSEHDMYIENYLRTGKKKIIGIGREVLGRRKDGSIFPIDLAVSEMQLGDRRMFTGIIRDISDRKQAEEERKNLEEQLRQSQKLEALGTLAGGIAHDFNNILGVILACASILEDEKIDPAKHAQSIAAIKETGERGASLVRQLLTFARKTDGRFEPVSMNDLIKDLIQMLTGTFPNTIGISLELETDLPPVIADSNQQYQALLNLCLNARDAMPEAGTLTITTHLARKEQLRERFPNLEDREYIHITVEDTGVGMGEETKERIFEPFFTTKAQGSGTGLGLAMVYGIVKAHHGFIEVESELNRGTSFHIYLPAVPFSLDTDRAKND